MPLGEEGCGLRQAEAGHLLASRPPETRWTPHTSCFQASRTLSHQPSPGIPVRNYKVAPGNSARPKQYTLDVDFSGLREGAECPAKRPRPLRGVPEGFPGRLYLLPESDTLPSE